MVNPAKNEKGFTLIELLIVLTIIGILAAIIIPQFSSYKKREYDSQAKASLHNLYLACKSFWSENTSTSPCKLSSVNESSYGFVQDTSIRVVINNGEENDFDADAQHTSSPISYSINSLGHIAKSD